MRNPHIRRTPALMLPVVLWLVGSASLRSQGVVDVEALIVNCIRPCASVTAAVAASGGTVTQQYENVDAVAVRVPRAAVALLVSVAGAEAVRKDAEIALPRPAIVQDVSDQLVSPAAAQAGDSDEQPANYNYNLGLINVAPLHASGKFGQNVVVAVIDSGTANVATIAALRGSVIGGESFVPAVQDPLSATHRENGSHGTMTAGMVAAHATFLFLNTSPFVGALNVHAPGSAIPCLSHPTGCGLPPATAAMVSGIPMTGSAPGAKIYAMKVFAASGGGSPASRIIAAMDRAITLRRNYNNTGVNTVLSGTGTESDPFVYSALKIDVVNMSLGGATLFAGRDIEDQLTLAMLEVGITIVASAGNDGFAAMTGGSPGTGFGTLTVGAASSAVHERILRELQLGPGGGAVYRPTAHIQTAYFSSRGPTADGRLDPDLVANGAFSWVQAYLALTATGGLADCREPEAVPGTCAPRLVFASGTSFSSPTTAGAAAVLRGAHPDASATQVRNALQKSANPSALGDDSTKIDQGNGLLDVAAADARLTSGQVSDRVPDLQSSWHDHGADELGSGGASVLRNVERAGFQLVRFRGGRYSARVRDLKPGEVKQIFVPIDALTSSFTVTIDKIAPELPPAQQNQLFICGPDDAEFLCGDDVFVQIVDSPTSFGLLRASGFPNVSQPFTTTVNHPQTGLARVALQGDWTNGGPVSATVTITRERRFDGLPTAISIIEQDEIDFIDVDVPAGAAQAVFELAWLQNWGRYPTNDLDLFLIDPAGNVQGSGATSNSPERVAIDDPSPGRWLAIIIGFTVHGARGHEGHISDDGHRKDVYTFRAEADGRRLKRVR